MKIDTKTILQKCFLCNSNITANNSKEHIIPNAIGGRKKVEGFICKECNHKSGYTWDAELAEKLNPLCYLFHINRKTGKVPPVIFETTKGKLSFNRNGVSHAKPFFKKSHRSDGKTEINIQARTKKETKKMLIGASKKYPKIDLNKELIRLEKQKIKKDYQWSYSPKFDLSYDIEYSSIKSILALATTTGITPELCKYAIEYLKNKNSKVCGGHYYEKDLLMNRPEKIPFHCVSIYGNPETKKLLGYIEYFGFLRFVFYLSNFYQGKKCYKTYAINPVDGKELDILIDFQLLPEIIPVWHNPKKVPIVSIIKISYEIFNSHLKRASEILYTGFKAQCIREGKRVKEDIIKSSLNENGITGDKVFLTDELIGKLAHSFTENYIEKALPFLKANDYLPNNENLKGKATTKNET